uniref:Uncharacterized protein n=1 Tax=Gossypium raimondii TaxID=29730 RepID=A0A0D2VJG3_GOSRA|nr:hypothetical protein B456_N001100 [Gossypium raimondii]
MQALPPRKLKAASKLIFMNGGFGGCHLFDSIHRIESTCKQPTIFIGVMFKKPILQGMGIGFNSTCTSRTETIISHSSIV